jgi:hypothetical protein
LFHCCFVFFAPTSVMTPAASSAATIMAITAPPAEADGNAAAFVGVGGTAETTCVRVEVGQGVEDGRWVGEEVGWVGVAV